MATAKARYWNAVVYPENMVDDWQDVIGDVIGYPVAYCVHDKDNLAKYKAKKDTDDADRQRKTHVHLVIAYGNTTTASAVLTLVNRLSAEGKRCANKVEQCFSIRNSFEYLIHNTDSAKKQGKYLYPESERICVNNFDIGAFEQIGVAEKDAMLDELEDAILEMGFTNYASFFRWVCKEKSHEYRRLVRSNSSHLRNLVKGNYHEYVIVRKVDLETGEIIED